MKFTENAINQLKKIIENSENPKSAIRFYTTQGCCSPTLQMELAENPTKDDVVTNIENIDFFVTTQADEILSNITLDYSNGTFRTSNDKKGGCC